eukprot:TRINITY_DN2057_c1_g1_i5.p1 TRINITY_DN2057_c1_g1~~TRINITY_DN2057_c1_g1_i5.p1  ORF type:complete len:226 (-),score=50.59 TRINITY_DN2057_c1_g1_i5:114-791(-)
MNEIVVKGLIALCRFIGYRRVARALAPQILEFSAKKATGSELPAKVVKVCLNTAPYVPAIALFSTTGIPGVLTTASYVFFTQVTDQLFLFVIYESVLGATRAVKYAFWPSARTLPPVVRSVKKSSDSVSKKEGKQPELPKQTEIENDWILVDENGDEFDEEVVKVDNLLDIIEKDPNVDKQVLKDTIKVMNQLVEKIDPEKEGWGVNAKDVEVEVEDEGFVVVQK